MSKKCKRASFLFTVSVCTLLVAIGLQLIKLTEANLLPISLLKMPEENINYTVSWVNGSLWAKVDGTYPIYKLDIEYQELPLWNNNTGFRFTGDTLLMVYPTPLGTTNISVKMDATELNWSNYTQIYPDGTHYTAIGDWPMISSTIYPILENFTLKIHYEHPIEQINGSYTFLYDLNISPYLSPWSNKSTAYFNIRFETNYTNLQVNTITVNGTLTPVNYTIIKGNETEIITLQVISEYSEPLPGDLLISFTEGEEMDQAKSGFSGSSLPIEYGYILATVVLTAIVAIAGYLSLKRKKGVKKDG